MVDPNFLSNASRKFHDLIQPYLNDPNEVKKMQLQVVYEKFTERNVENFLKLCQNIQTDCQNSEVKEICEIAKMFQADQIYNTGINFIRNNIDPNFNVSNYMFDESKGQTYLVLSPVVKKAHHFSDLNSLEFEDEDENADPNAAKETEKVPVNNNNNPITHSIIYRVKTIISSMKLPVVQFMDENGQVLYSAKYKDNTIVIGQGPVVHLNKDRSNHVGQITMEKGFNYVNCENQKFRVNFVFQTGPGTFSMDTEFLHEGNYLHWKPKLPKYNAETNSYTLSLHGEYHHRLLKSTKNTVLVNDQDKTCLIVRKVGEEEFEVECNPNVSKTVIFALALSQLIGPRSSN